MSSLLGSVFLFPLLFHFGGARGFFRWHGSGATSRQLDLLDHEATCISCPKDGPSQPRFGKSGCVMVSLRSPCGFGESPTWSVSPSVLLGGFWVALSLLKSRDFGGNVSGCVWPACSICTLHSARLEHACIVPRLGPGGSIGASKPPFSSWLGYLPSFLCARPTHVFGTAFQGSYETRWRMSPSPRDRRTGSCWS